MRFTNEVPLVQARQRKNPADTRLALDLMERVADVIRPFLAARRIYGVQFFEKSYGQPWPNLDGEHFLSQKSLLLVLTLCL